MEKWFGMVSLLLLLLFVVRRGEGCEVGAGHVVTVDRSDYLVCKIVSLDLFRVVEP